MEVRKKSYYCWPWKVKSEDINNSWYPEGSRVRNTLVNRNQWKKGRKWHDCLLENSKNPKWQEARSPVINFLGTGTCSTGIMVTPGYWGCDRYSDFRAQANKTFSPLVLSTLIYTPKLSLSLDLPLGHAHHDKSEMTSHTSWIFMPMWIKHTPYIHFKMWVNCTIVNIYIIPLCFWTSVLFWLLKTIHRLCGWPTTQINVGINFGKYE